jgi:DNA polymerase III epsilon subunit-like protein
MSKNIAIVDIEWADGTITPSILQFAAIKLNGQEEIIDSFFTFIKPSVEISDFKDILSIMPITSDDLLSGKDLSDVLPEFLDWCRSDWTPVLWGSYNTQVFERIMEGSLQIEHKTLDLQRVYEIISKANPVNLEKASISEGVKIFYPLHNALNDAYTLTDLYKTLNSRYDFDALIAQYEIEKAEKRREKRRAKRKRQAQIRAMSTALSYQYFIDMETGKIHKKGCTSLQETVPQLKGFGTLKGALKEGSDLCSLCFNQNISFDHDFTVSEKVQLINLHNLCANLNIKSKNQGRQFTMIKDVGIWYFMFGEGVPNLYHHNNIYPDKNNSSAHHYHKQPMKFTSYQDMIIYVQNHDRKVKSPYHWDRLIDKRS